MTSALPSPSIAGKRAWHLLLVVPVKQDNLPTFSSIPGNGLCTCLSKCGRCGSVSVSTREEGIASFLLFPIKMGGIVRVCLSFSMNEMWPLSLTLCPCIYVEND